MNKINTVGTLVLALVLTACSAAKTYQNRTGFLDSYEGIKQVSSNHSLYFEQMPDSNLSAYDKIVIPDIKVIANTFAPTPYEHKLYSLISAYTTAAYRQNIIKNSANYKVVDVAQKGAIVMQIAVSMIEVHPDDHEWDNLSALGFTLNAGTYAAYLEGDARILIEARITDAMTQRLLAHSVHAIRDEKIILHDPDRLQFSDVQAGLDRWLNESIVKKQ